MVERHYLLVKRIKGGASASPFFIGVPMEGYIVLFALCGAFWILFNA